MCFTDSSYMCKLLMQRRRKIFLDGGAPPLEGSRWGACSPGNF